jgi:type II secretory pathway pseudopilin PulG
VTAARARRRRGISMVEIAVAMLVLGTLLAPLVSSYWGLSRGFRKVTRQSIALMLCRAILDHIHYRLYNYSTHAFAARTTPAGTDPVQSIDYRPFFLSLNQPLDRRVATDKDGDRSTYFLYFGTPSAAGEWAGIRDPTSDFYSQLAEFSCLVEVRLGGIDTDMDRNDEKDMAEVLVTVHWTEDGIQREQRLQTVFTKYQYASGYR